MTPDQIEALGLEVRPDGRASMVVLHHHAAAAWIERHPRDRLKWRAVTAQGVLFESRTVGGLLDQIASNLPPRR